jgi:protein-S-isoprenylcysteine O-methyltransferase Ste14
VSARTAELPPRSGLAHFARELRYQEAARQIIGLVLIPLYAWLARPVEPLYYTGTVIAVVGIAVRLYASGYIVKNKELATDGPYSLVRHPLYTGNLLMLIGFALANGCWWSPILAIAFWWFYYPPAIEYEDRKLRRLFGDRCASWQQTIPAVLPKLRMPSAGGRWSLKTSLGRNLEPLIVLYSLFWLGWMALKL